MLMIILGVPYRKAARVRLGELRWGTGGDACSKTPICSLLGLYYNLKRIPKETAAYRLLSKSPSPGLGLNVQAWQCRM